MPDTPAHTTLGLVYTRTLLQPHQDERQPIESVLSLGMARVKSLLDVESDQPKNKHQSQTCVQDGEQHSTTNHKTLMLQNIASESLLMFQENRIRDLALQTKTNVDPLATNAVVAQPQRKNAETVAELSRGTPSTTTLSNRDTPTRNTPFDTNLKKKKHRWNHPLHDYPEQDHNNINHSTNDCQHLPRKKLTASKAPHNSVRNFEDLMLRGVHMHARNSETHAIESCAFE